MLLQYTFPDTTTTSRYHYKQYYQRYTPAFIARLDGAFAMSRYHALQARGLNLLVYEALSYWCMRP